MRNAGLDEAQAGIKIAGRNINNLRYADDTMLMAEREEELKSLLMKVKEESWWLPQGQDARLCPAVIAEGARRPTQLSLTCLRPPKIGRPGPTDCNTGSMSSLLDLRDQDGGEVHHRLKA